MNKPLCELTHIEALTALEAAERKIAKLTATGAPPARRARALLRPDDAKALPLPPLYHAVMAEINRLTGRPDEPHTPDDLVLLDALVDVAMVYEQCKLPGWLFPDVPRATPPQGETQ
jgi:hypothetical protein